MDTFHKKPFSPRAPCRVPALQPKARPLPVFWGAVVVQQLQQKRVSLSCRRNENNLTKLRKFT